MAVNVLDAGEVENRAVCRGIGLKNASARKPSLIVTAAWWMDSLVWAAPSGDAKD